ncbi:MAG: T9SS type A sorting domain-containing protein [Burkholderiales bacterium]|nr:T9SS type A sorting domain-containing protein [Bacteroidia bacterium]
MVTFSVSTIPLPGMTRGSAKWGDYDQDGDLDILLMGQDAAGTWNWYIFRNDPGGFNQQFNHIDYINFGDGEWGDFDNDGDLDVILSGGKKTFLYQNNSGTFIKLQSNFYGLNYASVSWVDYDNDNDLDLFLTGDYKLGMTTVPVSMFYRNNTCLPNSIPQAPVNLSSVSQGDSIIFSWNSGNDVETSSAGLYYNMYVGSISNNVDSLSPMSDILSGQRRVIAIGNACSNKTWKMKNASTGTYYWSVQSIDHAYAGSPFAPEKIITLIVGNDDVDKSSVGNELTVYPNPSNGEFKLMYIGELDDVKMEIFDAHAKLVFSRFIKKSSTNKSVDIKSTEISAGVYTLILTTLKGTITKKLVFL